MNTYQDSTNRRAKRKRCLRSSILAAAWTLIVAIANRGLEQLDSPGTSQNAIDFLLNLGLF